MPKHLQVAQINNNIQSDVNKKLIVQRSEHIVSGGGGGGILENWAKAIEKICNGSLSSRETNGENNIANFYS